MTSNPLVSAIIPTYNRAYIVCESIDSILTQTYPNIEVIVVDDGSTDDTLARLGRYGDKLRVVTQHNAGPAAARNRGIKSARGDLIAFLDSDDIWLPQMIERQVALLERVGKSVPCSLCNITMKWNYGNRTSFDIASLKPSYEEGLWLNADEVLATRFVLFNQGVVVRREALTRIGGFHEGIRYLEDYELPLRLSLEGPWGFIKKPLVVWRETMTSSVSKNALREELCTNECMVEILESHLSRIEKADGDARLRKYLGHGLAKARRQLWATRLSQRNGWGSIVAASAKTIERYRSALFRRSPWFPQMKVVLVKS
jgi:glycosyltransferase involved in cell wall biosynthesis